MNKCLNMFKFIVIVLYLQQFTASTPMKPDRLITYAVPDHTALKKALGFYEDTYLNFTELTSKYRYKSEEHTVITEDGYLLTVFRILPKCEQRQGYPVILAHGIYDSSDAWILNGPKTGLGYILSDNCYDVWAANLRGNVYSRKHIRLDPDKDPEFWEFSFDENGHFDLPAIIDYVLSITQQSKTYYIGHSQGSTDFFVMGSLKPEYNDKIRLSIQLAPVAWMKNLMSLIPKVIARQTKNIKDFFYIAGFRELFAKHQLIHTISEILCQYFPQTVCGTALNLSTGYIRGTITSKTLAVAIGHLLVGVSVKTLAHFGQLIVSENFQRFDEGREINIKMYGTATPPQYNVSLITSPIVLVCSKNDWISTLRDINILHSRLPNVVEKYIVPESTWSHNNHLWGVNATEYVFEIILNYFEKFNT